MIDLCDLERSCEELETKLSSSEVPNIGATAGKADGASDEHLLKIWCINIDSTRRTINSTTQRCRSEDLDHLWRQYTTND